MLSALTGVERSREQASRLMGGKYVLTGDSLLKMLAIYVRVQCGLPVVLMGECGCGKTMLIRYLCAWLGVELVVLDVHGGTSAREISAALEAAEASLARGGSRAFVFFDELNTCAHVSLMVEAMTKHSIGGRRLAAGLTILAAVNPYRLRPIGEADEAAGLLFALHEAVHDPLAALVYRVVPVPASLHIQVLAASARVTAAYSVHVTAT